MRSLELHANRKPHQSLPSSSRRITALGARVRERSEMSLVRLRRRTLGKPGLIVPS